MHTKIHEERVREISRTANESSQAMGKTSRNERRLASFPRGIGFFFGTLLLFLFLMQCILFACFLPYLSAMRPEARRELILRSEYQEEVDEKAEMDEMTQAMLADISEFSETELLETEFPEIEISRTVSLKERGSLTADGPDAQNGTLPEIALFSESDILDRTEYFPDEKLAGEFRSVLEAERLQEERLFWGPFHEYSAGSGPYVKRPTSEKPASEKKKRIVCCFPSSSSGASANYQNAVKRGLEWLARHQLPDGSWNFDHSRAENCTCGDPGTMTGCTNGATALGVLPFLGTGQTHREGSYKKIIGSGLLYLCRNMKADPQLGGSLWQEEGGMDAHGLASLCLTETYAMTKDRNLKRPAQAALLFSQNAQDPGSGGWGYSPGEYGNTQTTTLQLLLMRSGWRGFLCTSAQCVENGMAFLDLTAQEDGAFYGCAAPGKEFESTAAALLARIYCDGWTADHPALRKGVEWIVETGPTENVRSNFYATILIRQHRGDAWEKWHTELGERLVESQIADGSHADGSWDPIGVSGESDGVSGESSRHWRESGGRLYTTAFSLMTLEVYYRHMPIYQDPRSALPHNHALP